MRLIVKDRELGYRQDRQVPVTARLDIDKADSLSTLLIAPDTLNFGSSSAIDLQHILRKLSIIRACGAAEEIQLY